MNKLPERSDPIYKEIEGFKDYELTNNIAYEMAVRNDDVQNLMNLAGINPVKFTISNYMDSIISNRNEKEIVSSSIQKLVSMYGFDYFELITYKLNKETHKSRNPNNLLFEGAGAIFSPETTKIQDILNKDELGEVCKIEIEIYNNENWVNEDRKIKTNEEILAMCYDLEYPYSEKSYKIIKNALKRNNQISIKKDFSRPTIKPPYTPITNIDINLALPESELIAYIRLLKQKHTTYLCEIDKDNNKITVEPNTPLEFLGTQLQEADNTDLPKKPKRTMWADTFFIYDYVEARLKQIKNENAVIQEEYEKEVEGIKQSKIYDSFDKKIQLAQLAKEHSNNLINTGVKDIFNERGVLKEIDGGSGTVRSRYYTIKPYIEECKYKELITGVSSN